MENKKSRLGRGLSNLIAESQSISKSKGNHLKKDNNIPKKTSFLEEILIRLVDPSPYQARMEVGQKQLEELAASIRSEGLLQPIVVRKNKERYELIAGERRWRAVKILKWETVPARIIQSDNASSAILSLIENLQRENLNPIDEAMGISSLIRDFDLTQETVAQRIGKARTSVTNALRLLQLEQEIQGYLSKNLLSVGHAKALLSLENAMQRLLTARKVIEKGTSVRETEKLVAQLKKETSINSLPKPISNKDVRSAIIEDLQKRLMTHFNTRVSVKTFGKKGKLVIEYKNNEHLQGILEKIGFIQAQEACV